MRKGECELCVAQDEDDVTPLLLAHCNEHKDIALMLVRGGRARMSARAD